MTADDPIDPQSHLRQIARGWILRLASGEIDENSLAALKAWRTDPRHNAAFETERRLYRALQPLEAAFSAENSRQVKAPYKGSRTRARVLLTTAALAVAGVWLLPNPLILIRADRITGTGEIARLDLPDGSRAVLNSDTALNIAFDGKTRRVHILKGEAWFQVAHDRAHPFVVDANGATARAVGTAFSVSRDEDGGATLMVTQGRVAFIGADHTISVTRGQSARFQTGISPRLISVLPEQALAWRTGRVMFDNARLGDVAARLARYRRGYVLVLGDIAERRVSGVLEIGSIDRGLQGLADAQGLRLTHVTPWIVLLR